MKAMKRSLPILLSVLMVFALMPMSTGPVYAEDIPECTVILDPGIIGGQPVTVKSTEEGMMAETIGQQGHGMFQWDGNEMFYRYPNCPAEFTVPDGLELTGWTSDLVLAVKEPGFSTTVDGTLTLTAQWQYDGKPEKAYENYVIGFTGSSDGNINGACAYFAPVDGADGYAVQSYVSFYAGSFPIGGDIKDVEAEYSSNDNNYSVDLLKNGLIRDYGRIKVHIYSYKYYNGTKFYSEPLESEERAISVIRVWDPSLGGEIYVTKMSEDEDPNISVLIRDHWADRFLTDEGKYLTDDGEELVAVTPEKITSYDTYEELREAAWFLPGEDRDAGTVPEGDYLKCYPVWKSDLARFCADDHDLVFHEGTPETCTDPGMNPYYECNLCGTCFTDEQGQNEVKKADLAIPAKGHRSVTSTTKATLTANGTVVKKCGDCGEVLSTTKISRPTKFNLSSSSYVYSGSAKKPKVTVTDAAGKTIPETNYDLQYTNNKKVGKASVKVTLKGNYSGMKTLDYKILPKKAVISKTTPGSRQIKVTMKTKVTATGGTVYQIKYRVKGTSKWKTVTTKSQTRTIRNLKKGKVYQVKVRAYKSVNGTKYYGKWSKVTTTKKVK